MHLKKTTGIECCSIADIAKPSWMYTKHSGNVRIAAVLIDRANYGRLEPVVEALRTHPRFDLQILVGGSMLLDRFEWPADTIKGHIRGRVWCEVEGCMSSSIGLATQGFTQEFRRLQPDYVIVIGDRYEALGAATAAACLRIPIIHFQGGELSGSLDHQWRYASSHLADYHVPATELAGT